jgi:LAO/AO transport system kinase
LPRSTLESLLQRATKGNRRAISRLISLAENHADARMKILSSLYWKAGKAYVIGITGPPGCGKSTLIARLAKQYRSTGSRIGIVAVDPTSQISGGALLGDRIRMGDLASDPGVFIRSMASRGQSGGIARATEDVVRILDASAIDYVIVETTGVGQSDIDVKTLARTTIVVTAPGLGDEIQALKAGIMEIGDIFVVNKGDNDNADRTMQEINSTVVMSEENHGWRPPVIKTTATTGEGITALKEAIRQHSQYLQDSGKVERKRTGELRRAFLDATKRYFEDVTLTQIVLSRRFERLMKKVETRQLDPYTAARHLLQGFRGQMPASKHKRNLTTS